MSETLTANLPLKRWEGDRGTYHLVTFSGPEAEALGAHALMERLEMGQRRGFGSIKLTARIGDTEWRTSVFPQKRQSEWVLLISKKVMRAQDLVPGEDTQVTLIL